MYARVSRSVDKKRWNLTGKLNRCSYRFYSCHFSFSTFPHSVLITWFFLWQSLEWNLNWDVWLNFLLIKIFLSTRVAYVTCTCVDWQHYRSWKRWRLKLMKFSFVVCYQNQSKKRCVHSLQQASLRRQTNKQISRQLTRNTGFYFRMLFKM